MIVHEGIIHKYRARPPRYVISENGREWETAVNLVRLTADYRSKADYCRWVFGGFGLFPLTSDHLQHVRGID